MAEDSAAELELRDILGVFRRRRAVIAICAIVVTVVAVAASLLQTPRYRAVAKVLLLQGGNESLFDSNTGQRADPNRAAQTEIQILESQPVKDAVTRQIGTAPSISARTAGQTDVLEIVSTSTLPKRAAMVADAYASSYIDFKRKRAVDDLLAAAQQIQGKIDALQKQIDPLPNGSAKDALINQQAVFRQKLDQLQVDAALKTGGSQLVSNATVPTAPFSPRPVRSALLAALIGLFTGTGLAFLVEYLDDSIRTKEDLARIGPGVPVVGLIPSVANWKDTSQPRVVSIDEPKGPASEAYRTLRTSVQFLALERPMRLLQVTSPNAQEGKTTTLVNLGVAMARAGQRVIIVCCDLRRPRVHEFFGLDNRTGVTSVLLGKVPLTAALQPVVGQPRLSLLASGPLPPNPSELLSSKRTSELLSSLATSADIVLIDSPPVLPVTDALVLSGRVDATILVAVANATTRRDASHAFELLSQVDAPVVGMVLNGVTNQSSYGYDYGYDEAEEGGKEDHTPRSGNGARPAPARRR